ncbi:hypothetical protein [Parerythrobacter jejuensis]|uniref:Uncharacterized protein n=1 Tax=Parerythrobacter jejuensis TaxID=795812 RepID=A0A845ATD1_9SPHN|nr:hypothetical protein [Parerythrobacter jejuensis]MXP32759.1 hypothetical protein [Parerythrobacter jejuensis]
MDFRQRREQETFLAATRFSAIALSLALFTVLLTLAEAILYEADEGSVVGRCSILIVSGVRLGGPYLGVIMTIVAFGFALVAKKPEQVWLWRFFVYGSAVGLLASLILLIWISIGVANDNELISGMAALPKICVPVEGNAGPEIRSDLSWFLPALMVWFGGIIARQLGVKLPAVTIENGG